MTHILKFILALLLLAGCQDEVIESPDDKRPNPDGSVGFRLQIENSDINNDNDNSKTKGTPHSGLEQYDSVCVNVYSHTSDYEVTSGNDVTFFQKIKLEQKAPDWKYTPSMLWPVGNKLSFTAYASDIAFADAGITFEPSTGVPDSILYKVPSDVTKQPDLLVSTKFNEPQTDNVSLTMKHALACVSFCGIAPEGQTYVKSITLRNVYSEGTLALNDPSITWKVNPESKGITIFEAGVKNDVELDKDSLEDNNYLMTDSGYLMMIPQKLKDAAIDVLYWNKKDDKENKVITYILPVDDESYDTWKPGLKYIYKFGTQSKEDITVVYYEKYEGGLYGFQSNNSTLSLPLLNDAKEIIEAGYGVLSKSKPITTFPKIKLGLKGTPITAIKVDAVEGEYNLYAVSQTSINSSATFDLPKTGAPVEVYFDGNSVPCGKIIPHFAKGVSNASLSNYAIRTPQQMRNISALTLLNAFSTNATQGKVFEQERDLDFSKQNIGGSILNGAVVDETFSGTYIGIYNEKPKSISNVTISAPGVNYVGLFSQNVGILNDITLKASSIEGGNNVGGIAGKSYGDFGAVNRPRVIGTANSKEEQINIIGTSRVGGIVGLNEAVILGNDTKEAATEITVAEVSGWVNITGNGDFVGGIVGENGYVSSISRVLVNGVYVTGSTPGALTQSKIVIEGGQYVGGIVGNNTSTAKVHGNVTGSGDDIKNMPDVAGIVTIGGTNWVGGITGQNVGELNSVNIRLGRTPAMEIKGNNNVGGIVGENQGTLGVQSTNTFISIRGNIIISGIKDVGGIVGKNSSNAELKNCFVHDFYSQEKGNRVYYAPTIKASDSNAGGIAGSSAASITNSSVFSANSIAGITITTEDKNAGGLVGENSSGSNTTSCSLVGKIQVEAKIKAAGGILGDNKSGTTIKNCWVGSSDENKIIETAQNQLGIVITPPEITAPSYGSPFITGTEYIGGIVGLNDGGIIDGIKLADNVTIGRAAGLTWEDVDKGSNSVGGIAGGNTSSWDGLVCTIQNCSVENSAGKTVTIQGSRNLGGIVGLNNGIIKDSRVSGIDGNPLKINGLGTIGGIVGQNGGHNLIGLKDPNDPGKLIYGTGNDYTKVINSTVSGYVTIQGNIAGAGYSTATEVGGIIGLNGPTRNTIYNVDKCTVKGSNPGSIKITVEGSTGGIVGINSGNLRACDVYNVEVNSAAHDNTSPSTDPYAGGIAGITIASSTLFNNPEGTYRSDIIDCRVYSAIIISFGWGVHNPNRAGALVGYLNSTENITFGTDGLNYISNTGVSVNTNTPTQNNFIFGYNTGDGGIGTSDINHTVTTVPTRP